MQMWKVISHLLLFTQELGNKRRIIQRAKFKVDNPNIYLIPKVALNPPICRGW